MLRPPGYILPSSKGCAGSTHSNVATSVGLGPGGGGCRTRWLPAGRRIGARRGRSGRPCGLSGRWRRRDLAREAAARNPALVSIPARPTEIIAAAPIVRRSTLMDLNAPGTCRNADDDGVTLPWTGSDVLASTRDAGGDRVGARWDVRQHLATQGDADRAKAGQGRPKEPRHSNDRLGLRHVCLAMDWRTVGCNRDEPTIVPAEMRPRQMPRSLPNHLLQSSRQRPLGIGSLE